MKQISIILLSGFILLSSARADSNSISLFRVNRVQTSLPDLLNMYYDLKNALFSSDASEASAKAGLLLKVIDNVETGSLTEKDRAVFASLQKKLSFDARHISEARNIDQQREHFASLSLTMFTLAKSVSLSKKPVYEDYCPMKKAYWLSNEAEIKNPYFGEQMPDCGEIKNKLP